ncbi:MAG TPA: RHS repeat-associated core domain-containing protein, partial [Candidatus Sulfotelmatobacter sp.]|nr:RHS repeat-associated core domain-containing protein [Candidatus Sulfotelmatobacter sp.]
VVHYYFHDHLSSTNVVTDGVGNIQNESDYYPYGGEIVVSSGDSNRYKFTGKEHDAESNLDMFGARYYASTMGRFMTPDWAARPTAVPYASFGNPQSLNLYAYTKNNPTTLTDPNGHCTKGGQEKSGWWCFWHYSDQDEKRDADQARANLSAMHGLLIYGRPASVWVKTASDQQLISAQRDLVNLLAVKSPLEYAEDLMDGRSSGIPAVAGAIVNTASQIAGGHGWAKHQGEFPGWDQGKYEDTVRETMQQPDEVRTLSNNRTAYWNSKENMVVIENPGDPDGGTAFRPTNGKAYFDGLK